MKKAMMLLILVVLSCKSGKNGAMDTNNENTLLYYSKGPCLGKCPVYDLWVFTNGTVLFKGVDKVKHKGEVTMELSSEEIGNLALLLEHNLAEPTIFGKVRDLPVTTLRYEGKEYEYYVTKIDGQLKEVNSKIEQLVNRILSHSD
ncbi:DUF6438 domain-containing protein [Flavobacteriaceae bacterium 3-367]|uniref:DUF6438 domain-containing protein n=1 Tax=Eudoraea algarum TaxID=3417568 RepID=UPI00326ADA24